MSIQSFIKMEEEPCPYMTRRGTAVLRYAPGPRVTCSQVVLTNDDVHPGPGPGFQVLVRIQVQAQVPRRRRQSNTNAQWQSGRDAERREGDGWRQNLLRKGLATRRSLVANDWTGIC